MSTYHDEPSKNEIRSIRIGIINHRDQRYETSGDWVYDPADGELIIYVSDLQDWRQSVCIGLHEAAEAAICVQRGIKQKDVDAFDIAFEANRVEGDDREPGDDPHAPYREAHQTATEIEFILAQALGIGWREYENNVNSLS